MGTSHTAVELFRRVLAPYDFDGIRWHETVAVGKAWHYSVVTDTAFVLVEMGGNHTVSRYLLENAVSIEETAEEANLADSDAALRSRKIFVELFPTDLPVQAEMQRQRDLKGGPDFFENIFLEFFTFQERSMVVFFLRQAWRNNHIARLLNRPLRMVAAGKEAVTREFHKLEQDVLSRMPIGKKIKVLEELSIATDRYRLVKRLLMESRISCQYIIEELSNFSRFSNSESIGLRLPRDEALTFAGIMVQIFERMLFNSECIRGCDRVRCMFEVGDRDALQTAIISVLMLPLVNREDFGDRALQDKAYAVIETSVACLNHLLQVNVEAELSHVVKPLFAQLVTDTVCEDDLTRRVSDWLFSLMHLLFQNPTSGRTVHIYYHAVLLHHLVMNSPVVLNHMLKDHQEELTYVFKDDAILLSLRDHTLGPVSLKLIEEFTDYCFLHPRTELQDTLASVAPTQVAPRAKQEYVTPLVVITHTEEEQGPQNRQADHRLDHRLDHRMEHRIDPRMDPRMSLLFGEGSVLARRQVAALTVRTSGAFDTSSSLRTWQGPGTGDHNADTRESVDPQRRSWGGSVRMHLNSSAEGTPWRSGGRKSKDLSSFRREDPFAYGSRSAHVSPLRGVDPYGSRQFNAGSLAYPRRLESVLARSPVRSPPTR